MIMGDYEKQQGSSDSCYSNSSSDEVSLAEDASSSISSCSSSFSSHARGPLYGLSEVLMAQLPIKRGLSKFYDGKSQSFSCLKSVRSIEDLRKSYDRSKRLKVSKSYEDDLDRRPSPVVVIPKKIMEMKKKKKKLGGCSSLRRASYLPA